MPSSVVSSVKYDPVKEILRIAYVSGSVYDYLHVPYRIFNAMKSSFSKGTFLNRVIKRRYAFKKVRG